MDLEEYGIVPDILDSVENSCGVLKIEYGDIEVRPGDVIVPTEATSPPSVSWSCDDDLFYTLFMTDPDAPSIKEPTAREYIHWVVTDIPGYDVKAGNTVVEYLAPIPSFGSGRHRYCFLVYEQQAKGDVDVKKAQKFLKGRAGKKISAIVTFADLGDPVAATLFISEWIPHVDVLQAKAGYKPPVKYMSSVQKAKYLSESPDEKEGYTTPGLKSFFIANTLFEIDSRYEHGKVLGMGAYGVVISAKTKKRKCAIKKILDWSGDWVDGLRILREVKLMHHFRLFRHKNLICLNDLMASPVDKPFDDIYVVMDLMDTDMNRIIYSKNKLTDQHYQEWIRATLKGLRFMHTAGVAHRDLKPANLLLNKNCQLKICDYGLARGLGSEVGKDLTEYVVTRWYRAPEIVCGCVYNEKIDVWALGCIFGEMLGRKPLFPGKDFRHQFELIIDYLGNPSEEDIQCIDNESVQEYVRKMSKRVPMEWGQIFPNGTEGALDLLSKMLLFNPEKRISVEDALNHFWLRDIERDDDLRKDICPEKLDFAFENESNLPYLDRRALENQMWGLLREIHPEYPWERKMNGPLSGPTTGKKKLDKLSALDLQDWFAKHKRCKELKKAFPPDTTGQTILLTGRKAILIALQNAGVSEMVSKSIYRELMSIGKTSSTTTTTTTTDTTK